MNRTLANIVDPERVTLLARLANDPNDLNDRSRLRLWRVARGMTASQVAEKIGLKTPAVTRLETVRHGEGGGIRSFSLEKYLSAIRLTRAEFLGGPLVSPLVGLAARLHLWRLVAGLTMEELATVSGVPRGTVARWFHRRATGTKVRPEQALAVSKALGVPFDVLMQGLRTESKTKDKEAGPTEVGVRLRRQPAHVGFGAHPEHIFKNLKKARREAATSEARTVTTVRQNGPAGRTALTDNALAEVLAVAIVKALDEYTKAQLVAPATTDDVRTVTPTPHTTA